MSTRSRIGLEGEDRTIRSVYCHFDGYPEGVGAALLAHHNSAEAALALVELGDLSSCAGPEVAPPGERQDESVISYRLWRNEADTDAVQSFTRADYLRQARGSGGEYAYLYGPRGWEVAEVPWGEGASMEVPFLALALLLATPQEQEAS